MTWMTQVKLLGGIFHNVPCVTEALGDTREERTFRMWVNSLEIENLYLNDLFADLTDGIGLLKIMDRIQPGA